jgi:hypothetical protein
MAANESMITRFPGGIGQFTFLAAGAAAGDVTVSGVKATDKLLLVQSASFDGDGDIVAVADLTSEFSVTDDDTINNTGGTSTADELVSVTIARTVA